jgi:AraC family transcriptional regulator
MNKLKPDQKKQNRYLWEEYISRINRVIDYIDKNIEEELSLRTLAQVAHFSPYHFHRIFKAFLGETLNQYIRRVRLAKAANQLTYSRKKSITDIALESGFSSSAAFSRAFRETFNTSPSAWRSLNIPPYPYASKIGKPQSKLDQFLGNIRKDFDISLHYNDGRNANLKWRIKMKEKPKIQAQVEIKEMPAIPVAYVRHIGPYKGDSDLFEGLFTKLMTWAGPRNLIRFPDTQMLTVYHDDPEITDEDKLRTSVCISVPEETKVDGEIGKMTVPGGKFAVARFELANHEYPDAWNAIFGGWLPESGYQPDDRLCYEMYHNNPKEHPQNKCIVDICIPVRPM